MTKSPYIQYNFCVELVKKCWDPDPKNRPTADQIIQTMKTNGIKNCINDEYHDSKEYDVLRLTRTKRTLLKLVNLIDNPGTYYTSRFLSFQRVKDHLSKLASGNFGNFTMKMYLIF